MIFAETLLLKNLVRCEDLE